MKAFLYMLSNLAVDAYDGAHTVRENQGGRDFGESRGKEVKVREIFLLSEKIYVF